ncbi:MAG: hypothetical protein HYR84_02325 [Planctomycetes bacterium]|nr:hypothetical protein [Planctomycetota bacterium]
MITATEIKKRLSQEPFTPFRIVTSSGTHYDIPHPEFLMVGKRVLGVGTVREEGDEEIDGVDVISILHVTALEMLTPARRKKK